MFFLIKDTELDHKIKADKWTELLAVCLFFDAFIYHEWLNRLFQEIRENEMGPFYDYVCREVKIPIDKGLQKDIADKNKKRISEIESEIDDAENNLGIFILMLKKCSINKINK